MQTTDNSRDTNVNVFYLLCFTVIIANCSFSGAQESLQQTALERALAGEMVSLPGGSFDVTVWCREYIMGHADYVGPILGLKCTDSHEEVTSLSRGVGEAEASTRTVTVPGFKLGKYEVTVSRFRAFVEATGYRTDAERDADGYAGCVSEQSEGDWDWVPNRSWRDPGYPVEDDQPVACVSWNDAQAFIDWLNEKAGGNFRLPSEAEWEYAARAGSVTKYHFGDSESELCKYANHADRSTDFEWRNESCSDGVGRRAAAVGSYQPNGYGLYDMHGNVWEWVQDCWNDDYEGAPTDGSAWTGGDCGRRVVRGGAWGLNARHLRSANRDWNDRTDRSSNVGFRLAQDE
ncbi:MAG: formylglycine-generating enzyme family protein [Gammaproteobacteria bacterium]|nr:formylglycine-generating enzyme family protein [Gammaproteobacteria bacterium]